MAEAHGSRTHLGLLGSPTRFCRPDAPPGNDPPPSASYYCRLDGGLTLAPTLFDPRLLLPTQHFARIALEMAANCIPLSQPDLIEIFY